MHSVLSAEPSREASRVKFECAEDLFVSFGSSERRTPGTARMADKDDKLCFVLILCGRESHFTW